ncbi:Transcriptional regulator, IclR family [uncultured Rubrobacteraceae bacterium]|uniref:Transcriptional regulator, IclR family n=1 Tax=uncultured Rubrobacteraceae bacterium TaxID=349277 RepID=A0A6J4PTV0_9ACTN|nr:Transcriptional regulator, IclR family [uncultured Rubrobacteraceae bacterium]
MDSIEVTSSGGKSGVGVLDKSVAILAYLSGGAPASLAEVVAGTGFPRPTAHRLLSALETHHLVSRRGGRYVLGLRLLGWGNRAAGVGLVERARPVLEGLRDGSGESTQLYVREGEQRVCVASVERVTGLRDSVPVGAVMPLSRGSAGKILLAFAPGGVDDSSDAAELRGIRVRGWAESVAEREAGVASVSAPVFGEEGRIRAAVSVSGPISRLGENPGQRLSHLVVEAAREIESTPGGV